MNLATCSSTGMLASVLLIAATLIQGLICGGEYGGAVACMAELYR